MSQARSILNDFKYQQANSTKLRELKVREDACSQKEQELKVLERTLHTLDEELKSKEVFLQRWSEELRAQQQQYATAIDAASVGADQSPFSGGFGGKKPASRQRTSMGRITEEMCVDSHFVDYDAEELDAARQQGGDCDGVAAPPAPLPLPPRSSSSTAITTAAASSAAVVFSGGMSSLERGPVPLPPTVGKASSIVQPLVSRTAGGFDILCDNGSSGEYSGFWCWYEHLHVCFAS
jgi:hypothetical protein